MFFISSSDVIVLLNIWLWVKKGYLKNPTASKPRRIFVTPTACYFVTQLAVSDFVLPSESPWPKTFCLSLKSLLFLEILILPRVFNVLSSFILFLGSLGRVIYAFPRLFARALPFDGMSYAFWMTK